MIKVALSGSREYKTKVTNELKDYDDIEIIVSCFSANVVVASEVEFNNNITGANITIANNKKITMIFFKQFNCFLLIYFKQPSCGCPGNCEDVLVFCKIFYNSLCICFY